MQTIIYFHSLTPMFILLHWPRMCVCSVDCWYYLFPSVMHFRKRWESRLFIFFKKKYFYPRISRDSRAELSLRKENSKGDGKQRETFVISMRLLAWHFPNQNYLPFQNLDNTGNSILLPIYSSICIMKYAKKPLSRKKSKKIILPYVSFLVIFRLIRQTMSSKSVSVPASFLTLIQSKRWLDNANSSCFIIKLFYLN